MLGPDGVCATGGESDLDIGSLVIGEVEVDAVEVIFFERAATGLDHDEDGIVERGDGGVGDVGGCGASCVFGFIRELGDAFPVGGVSIDFDLLGELAGLDDFFEDVGVGLGETRCCEIQEGECEEGECCEASDHGSVILIEVMIPEWLDVLGVNRVP